MSFDDHELPCMDCGVNTGYTGIAEYYHVWEEVWNIALGRPDAPTDEFVPGLTDAGYLCIGCIEERLGRRLTVEDFSDAPINQPEFCVERFGREPSLRMLQRLSR